MRGMVRVLGSAVVAVGASIALAAPVGAHVTTDKDEVAAGSFSTVTLSVSHGCEESPTRQLTVQIPEGVTNVSPQVHPTWEIEVTEEELDEPIEAGHGDEITTRVSEVSFTAGEGNELPAHYRDSFTIGFRAPETPGEYLFFKSVQTCVEGEHAWIEEYTGEGEEPEEPSPVLAVTEAADDGHGADDGNDDGEMAQDGDSEAAVDEEAIAATATDDSNSSTGLAIAALVVGVLGLGAGGLALARTRKTAAVS